MKVNIKENLLKYVGLISKSIVYSIYEKFYLTTYQKESINNN
jgi:hypothetical protein